MSKMNTLAVVAVVVLLGAASVAVFAQHLSGDVDDYADCIDRWLATKPDMTSRFDRRQIAWLCERSQMWQRRAASKPAIINDDILTTDQRRWLFNLRTCQGYDCIPNVVQQRCQDRRCRQPPFDRQSTDPPPPLTTPQPVAGDALEKIDQLISDFLTLNADDVNFEETILFPSEDQEGPDDQTVEGAVGPTCQFKVKVARLCPVVLNGTFVATVLPKIVADLRSEHSGAADLEDEIEKTNLRLTKLSAKCDYVIANLLQRSLTFDYFVNECSEERMSETRSRIGVECLRVLQAKTAGEALPEMSRRLQGRRANSHLGARFEELIEEKYEKWLNRCSRVAEELGAVGGSFASWAGNESEKEGKNGKGGVRTKRADPSPAKFDDDMTVDLDDADFRAQRKEIRQMSDDERQKFFAALNRLKNEKIDNISMYDLLVIYHTPEESPGAHWGPAFLPFHREWLKQLEVALRQLDPDVSVPYWDSTLDEGLPTPRDAILWTDAFFGGNNGTITSGPFANWVATHELGFVPSMKTLYRDVGTSPFGGLFKESDIEFAMSRERFEDFTACVDPTFELVHGVVHMFVGGYMADMAISPNDPTFFMHHCFVDYIWEQWRKLKQTPEKREQEYPTDDRACNDFHYGSHQMQPFAVKNIDGLRNNYTQEFYFYSSRPRCNNTIPDCGSPYIFCDTKKYRCLSKVQIGGNCTGFEGTNICFGGVCANGKCVAQDNQTTTATVTTTTTTTTTTTKLTTTPSTTTTTTTPTPTISSTSTSVPTTTIKLPSTPNPDEVTTPSSATPTTSDPATETPTTPLITTPTPISTPNSSVAETDEPTSSALTATTAATTETTTALPITTMTTLPETTPSAPTTPLPTTPTFVTTTLRTPTPRAPATTPAPTPTPTSPADVTATFVPSTPSTAQSTPTSVVETTSTSIDDGFDSHDDYGKVIGWDKQAPFPVVYFTISVVQGEFRGVRQEARKGAPNCHVTVTGLNVPSGYTQSMSGLPFNSSAHPEYLSGAVVRAMDPAKAGYFPLVEVGVSVTNANGAPCSRFCFDGKQYQPCDDEWLKLSTDSQYSDPVVFHKTLELAKTANWAGRGYYRTRKEDYLLFQCPPVYG